MAQSWYSAMNTKELRTVCSADGLREFAETGRLRDFPESMARPLPIHVRESLLRNLLAALHTSGGKYSNILDSSAVSVPKLVVLQKRKNILCMAVLRETAGAEAFLGNGFCILPLKGMADDFENVMDYLYRSRRLLRCEVARSILEDLIRKCSSQDVMSSRVVLLEDTGPGGGTPSGQK